MGLKTGGVDDAGPMAISSSVGADATTGEAVGAVLEGVLPGRMP